MFDINMIGEAISLGVSWVLMFLAFWGCIVFYPNKKERGDSGPAWLILAIWIGFLGAGLNSFYWRVFSDIALRMDWLTVTQIRAFGQTWGDIMWKGAGAASVYLHFYSRWKFLPPEERKSWRPLLMGWYPDDQHWAVRFCTFRWRKDRDEQTNE